MVDAVGMDLQDWDIDHWGKLCCNRMCGTCGGPGCEKRPGGATQCCANPINAAGNVCRSDSDVHCVIEAHPKCESGILDFFKNVCCPKSCGKCGGRGCETRPGGPRACCTQNIEPTRRICQTSGETKCIMPPGEPHLEYLDNKWNGSGVIAAGMLASASFMAAGLVVTLVALLKRHRTGAMADPLLHPEYSLIKEEGTM
eukprot:CAMPEP_0172707542 /NCGR_PEP_ID=MMETSP1074-20121228/50029_1 /TAXON_ID=2916 /ORGANISM="Ceratium fusus, Strain PA161109" /LENGTH=198 /DNA_ID=CAMNT_0013530367 /DNA_START=104 /DNA_END=701 /DNA_ORIENTATION=+